MTRDKVRKEIKKITEELTKKRGKHSSLWLYPKNESLDKANNDLLSLFDQTREELVGEEEKEMNIKPNKKKIEKIEIKTDFYKGFGLLISNRNQEIIEKINEIIKRLNEEEK